MSEDMWCDYFYENIKKLCALAKSYGITVMMHSCGGIKPLIPHLIKAGVEILDPIQITAKDMEPAILSKEFGKDLIFHGALDTQRILPMGTVEEVVEESKRLIDIFAKDGGFIFAPGQVLNNDVPVENIDAMYKTVNKLIL